MKLVDQILAKADSLPALPGVAQQVLATLQDPDFSFKQVMDLVRMDPGITAHVLRMANSPIFGLKRQIGSLEQALTYLGAQNILEIVISSEMVQIYRGDQQGYRLERGDLWRHSMCVALLAQRLGERVGQKDLPSLFTAGLLHDVGKLILSQYVGEQFARIEDMVNQEGMSFVAAERQVLGVDHALLGAVAARRWRFPENIANAIAFHHMPERSANYKQFTALVALANVMCVSMGVGGGAEGLAVPASAELVQSCGLQRGDMDMIALDVKDILDQAEALLGLAAQ